LLIISYEVEKDLVKRKRLFTYIAHKQSHRDWQQNKMALYNWLIAITHRSCHTEILAVDKFESILHVYAGYA
jgi:hypothetical protein